MYVYQDFSKTDKKLLQSLMNLAVQRKIKNFTKKTLPIHKAIVEDEHEDIRVPFWKMADQFYDFRKAITSTFDEYRHRDIPTILAGSIVDGDLRKEDLASLSPKGKQKMEELINMIESF